MAAAHRCLLVLLACDLLACDAPAEPEPEPAPEVADLEACAPAAMWPAEWTAAEVAVLAELNAMRAEGGRCGDLQFDPAPPLRMDPTLRCAARLHTLDMIARQYVSSIDPDGVTVGTRLFDLGYAAAIYSEVVSVVTEAVADPEDDAHDAVVAWRDNPASCWQLRARELTAVGIGGQPGMFTPKDKDPTPSTYWTLTVATP